MKSFRRSAARSPISVFCTLLLLIPIIGAALMPIPAAAQAGTQEVAVVDFRNTSKTPNEMFATMASDAVVVELLRSGKFSVVTADALQSKMEELGYKEKGRRTSNIVLSPTMMTRLGQEVGAAAVVSGEVTDIHIDQAKNKAQVHILVRLLDVISGEFINGAAATGESYPRIGYTPDKDTDWVIEAINNAASKAVGTMVSYIIPEATVIGTFENDQILLNKGSRDGINPGQEMIIVRRGEAGNEEVVGRCRVTQASNTDARAYIIKSTRGAQPEDKVRAVYAPPEPGKDSGDVSPRAAIEKRNQGGTQLLMAALLAAGLFALLKPGGNGSNSLSNAVAASFYGTTDLGTYFGDGGIAILFNTPSGVRYDDILQYHIWRDTSGSALGEGTTANMVGPVRTPGKVGMPVNGALGKFANSTVDDANVTTSPLGWEFPSTDHTSLQTATTTIPPITPGKTHSYWVSAVYQVNPSDASTKVAYWETAATYAGKATYFAQRPIAVSPGDVTGTQPVDLSNVTFEWDGCRASDSDVTYVIEVGRDLNFTRATTWVSPAIRYPTSTDGQAFTQTFTNVLNNSTELNNITSQTTLYWRVGARASIDSPGPYPAGPAPLASGAKNTRFIYSDPSLTPSFTTTGGVPNPPGGSASATKSPTAALSAIKSTTTVKANRANLMVPKVAAKKK